MGYATCIGRPRDHHRERRVCWRCDACPVCDGVKILRGDYCTDCTAAILAAGGVWDPDRRDYKVVVSEAIA